MSNLRQRALLGCLVGTPAQQPRAMAEATAAEMIVATSTTSFGRSGSHSLERLVDQRLGPPGALPVKPGGSINGFSFLVSAGLSWFLIVEVKPT